MGHDSLSSIFGWISLACWIVVYSPQIAENYKRKSGQGLSVSFVVTWLLGDLCSLVGALWARLLPTVIMLAAYYSICDTVLLFQIYYYRWANPQLVEEEETNASEETPLIHDEEGATPSEKQTPLALSFIRYVTALLFVFATGVAAWALDNAAHGGQHRERPEEVFEWKSQVLGWTSAILFLSARIPQILKNFKSRCDGLSPALFLFSISGNSTYAISICLASMEPRYLLANASWLAGSALTVFLDLFVLGQFAYYRSVRGRVSL